MNADPHECKFTRTTTLHGPCREAGLHLEQHVFRVSTCRTCGAHQPSRRGLRAPQGIIRRIAKTERIALNDRLSVIAAAVASTTATGSTKLARLTRALASEKVPQSEIVRGLNELMSAGLVSLEFADENAHTPRGIHVLSIDGLKDFAHPERAAEEALEAEARAALITRLEDAIRVAAPNLRLAPLHAFWTTQMSGLLAGNAEISGPDGVTLLTSRSTRYARLIEATLDLAFGDQRTESTLRDVDSADIELIELALGEPFAGYDASAPQILEFNRAAVLAMDPQRPVRALVAENLVTTTAHLLLILRNKVAFETLAKMELPGILLLRVANRPTETQARVIRTLASAVAHVLMWPEIEPVGLLIAEKTMEATGRRDARYILVEPSLLQSEGRTLGSHHLRLAEKLTTELSPEFRSLCRAMADTRTFVPQVLLVAHAERTLRGAGVNAT